MSGERPPDDPDLPVESVFLDGESIVPSWQTAGVTCSVGQGTTIHIEGSRLLRYLLSQKFDYRRPGKRDVAEQ